ncbi:MAG TPA: DUF2520 domain-containing protein [Bryobacteraceae bacterium]|nr:DUF2520 domain-containing protein [Bryobacteraceae bacterium]
MKKLRPLALVCAGPVSRSPLARLPNLSRSLGWVKSTSYRVASRAVNALGAGAPVADVDEMARAVVWVVSVPRADLHATLSELWSAQIRWDSRVLLILDSEAESEVASCFRAAGAAVASFAPIDADSSRYVVEGDAEAVLAVRALIDDPHRRSLVQIKKGAKAKYLAGARTAATRMLSLIAEAVESFQSAGISNSDAKRITESLVTGAMRLYLRAGRRSLKL